MMARLVHLSHRNSLGQKSWGRGVPWERDIPWGGAGLIAFISNDMYLDF